MPVAARMLVPFSLLLAASALAPSATAAVPARVEIALAPSARAAAISGAIAGLHVGPVRTIAPLHVLVVRTRRPALLIARLRSRSGVAAIARARVYLPAVDTET